MRPPAVTMGQSGQAHMPKIVEYVVVYSWEIEEFNLEITQYLSKGWQPYGSPCYTVEEGSCSFAQAMVRYEEEAK